ncbi:unnamed protein product [Umbelopsis sp. WA50703]
MAPFYRGQQDLNPVYSNDSTEVGHSIGSKAQVKPGAHQSLILLHPKISLWSKYRPHRKESLSQPPPLYKDAVECPICFLDGEKDEHGLEDHSIVTIDRIRPQHTRILSSRHHRDAASSSAIGSTRRIIVRPNGTDPEHFTSAGRDYRDYLTAVRQMNMDLEELMVMEAIRLSLIEQSTESSQSTSDSTTPNTNRSIQDHPLEL